MSTATFKPGDWVRCDRWSLGRITKIEGGKFALVGWLKPGVTAWQPLEKLWHAAPPGAHRASHRPLGNGDYDLRCKAWDCAYATGYMSHDQAKAAFREHRRAVGDTVKPVSDLLVVATKITPGTYDELAAYCDYNGLKPAAAIRVAILKLLRDAPIQPQEKENTP